MINRSFFILFVFLLFVLYALFVIFFFVFVIFNIQISNKFNFSIFIFNFFVNFFILNHIEICFFALSFVYYTKTNRQIKKKKIDLQILTK